VVKIRFIGPCVSGRDQLKGRNITHVYRDDLGQEILPSLDSCRDHEGGGGVKFQQWDGKQWTPISDWMASEQALVRP
jgi:branched-chain amino acid transport system substrate-binding protein